jgi:hypothetical protein
VAYDSRQNNVSYTAGEAASSLKVHMKCRANRQTGSKFLKKKSDNATSETKLSSLNKENYVKIQITLLNVVFCHMNEISLTACRT